MTVERFAFAFDRRYAPVLALLGIRAANSEVLLSDEVFDARFGRLRCVTPVANLKDVQVTRDYRAHRAIGPRGSLADHGATFGTNTRAGACVCFHEPVPALVGRLGPHPALTVTVEDPEALAAAIRRRLTASA